MTNQIHIVDVTIDNVDEAGIYCIKNKREPGYQQKLAWFKAKINNGLKIKIVADDQGKQHGFIEFIASEQAWRPVDARSFYFIQCIALFGKEMRSHGIGAALLKECEKEARENNMLGLCTMTSDGPWMANKELFIKNGFAVAEQLGRFELLYKVFESGTPLPKLNDWTAEQSKYKGWNLVYSDQCPWHDKSVKVLAQTAEKHGINLTVTRLVSPKMAQKAPSGFGTYTLIKDGKVLADHYISNTRFENILKQESP